MDIYIKPVQKANIYVNTTVYLEDVAEVFTSGQDREKIKKIKIYEIQSKKKNRYLLTILDIIEAVSRRYPDAVINNVGEKDTIIQYFPFDKKENKMFTWLKVSFVSVVLFMGASTAIMSFHTDSQIPEVLKNYYYIFFGERINDPMLIYIPYSIGIAVGITVFYNHFSKKYMSLDPTPIEIELTLYETQTNESVIDSLSAQKKGDPQ